MVGIVSVELFRVFEEARASYIGKAGWRECVHLRKVQDVEDFFLLLLSSYLYRVALPSGIPAYNRVLEASL